MTTWWTSGAGRIWRWVLESGNVEEPLKSSPARTSATSSGKSHKLQPDWVFPAHALRSITLYSFFRDKSPYTFPGGVAKIVNKNAARVAEVREWTIQVWNLTLMSPRSGWMSGETSTTAWTLELEMLTLETFRPGKLWGKIWNVNPSGGEFFTFEFVKVDQWLAL